MMRDTRSNENYVFSSDMTDDCFSQKTRLEESLTICIAAICELDSESPKIVYCSDAMLTTQDDVQFEHTLAKIVSLSPNCNAMLAAKDILRSTLILDAARKELDRRVLSIENTTKLLAKHCRIIENEDRENSLLRKFGLTYKHLTGNSKQLSDTFLRIVSDYLIRYKSNFECEFMVYGFDPKSEQYEPQIYVVNQSGEYKPYDYLGFATIGIGADLALAEMTRRGYRYDMTLGEAAVKVYSAKKVAERARDVGKHTTMGVLHLHNSSKRGSNTKNIADWSVDIEAMEMLDKYIEKAKKKEKAIYREVMIHIAHLFDDAHKKSKQGKQTTKEH